MVIYLILFHYSQSILSYCANNHWEENGVGRAWAYSTIGGLMKLRKVTGTGDTWASPEA